MDPLRPEDAIPSLFDQEPPTEEAPIETSFTFGQKLRAGAALSGLLGSEKIGGYRGNRVEEGFEPTADPLFWSAPPQMRDAMLAAKSPEELEWEWRRGMKELQNREARADTGFFEGLAVDLLTDPAAWAQVAIGVATAGASTGLSAGAAALRVGLVEAGTAAITSSARELHRQETQAFVTPEESARMVATETVLSGLLGGAGGAFVGRTNTAKARTVANMREAEKIAERAERQALARVREKGIPLDEANYRAELEQVLREEEGFEAVKAPGVGRAVARAILVDLPTKVPVLKHMFATPVWTLTESRYKAARTGAHIYSSAPIARRGVSPELQRASFDVRADAAAGRFSASVGRIIKLHKGLKDSALSREQFERLAYEATHYGDDIRNVIKNQGDEAEAMIRNLTDEEINAINGAAREARERVEEMHVRGAMQGLWPWETDLGGTATTYFTRAWDNEAVRLNGQATIDMVDEWDRVNGLELDQAVKDEIVENLRGGKGFMGLKGAKTTDTAVNPQAKRAFEIPQDFEWQSGGRTWRVSELQQNQVSRVLEHHGHSTMREIILAETFGTEGMLAMGAARARLDRALSKLDREAEKGALGDGHTPLTNPSNATDAAVRQADEAYIDAYTGYVEDLYEVIGAEVDKPLLRRRGKQLAGARKKLYDKKVHKAWLEDEIELLRAKATGKRSATVRGVEGTKMVDVFDESKLTAFERFSLRAYRKKLKDVKAEIEGEGGLSAAARQAREDFEAFTLHLDKRAKTQVQVLRKAPDPTESWRWSEAGVAEWAETLRGSVANMQKDAADRAIRADRLLFALRNQHAVEEAKLTSKRSKAKLEKEFKQAQNDLILLNNRARMINPRAQDPGSMAARVTNVAKTLNYSRLLGSVALSSAMDIANMAAYKGGLGSIFQGAQLYTRSLFSKRLRDKLGVETMREFFHATEIISYMNRLNRYGGLTDASFRAGNTADARAMQGLSRKFMTFSGMGLVNREMKTFVAITSQHRMAKALKKGFSPKDKAWLARLRIGDEMIERWQREFEANGEKWDGYLNLANLDEWNDLGAARAWEDAISQSANEIVITPGVGDRPGFMDDTYAGVLFQLRSFLFAHFGRNIRTAIDDPNSNMLQWMVTATVFGGMNDELRRLIRDEDPAAKREAERHKRLHPDGHLVSKFLDWSDRAGVIAPLMELNNYANLAGGDIKDLIEGGARALGADDFELDDETTARYRNRTDFGRLIGPTGDLAERGARFLKARFDGEADTQGEWASHARLLPGNNLFYLEGLGHITSPFIRGEKFDNTIDRRDSFVRTLAERLGAPEKRER